MADAPNGLASLAKARESRVRRTMPPPRHPVAVDEPKATGSPSSSLAAPPQEDPRSDRVEVTGVELSTPADTANSVTSSTETRRPPRKVPQQTAESAVQFQPAVGEGSGSPRPVTLYLDNSQISFLEEAHIAGLLGTPRLDLSKSAVVRLALRRLQAEMSVEQIAAVLRDQPTDPTKTGRKRR